MGAAPAQERWWAGEGGNAYLARNRVDWRARIPFWRRILDATGARSVFELGCNAGWNLSAIRRVCADAQVSGADVNALAIAQAKAAGVRVITIPESPIFDLTFTAGVLIHVSPQELTATMKMIVAGSAQYVLAVEYEAEEEQEIEYRGESGLLWKRPYGKLYEAMGLKPAMYWEPQRVPGFDRCSAWLMEKQWGII